MRDGGSVGEDPPTEVVTFSVINVILRFRYGSDRICWAACGWEGRQAGRKVNRQAGR
jgi:hypothetical protein